jgi:hypothetical protein
MVCLLREIASEPLTRVLTGRAAQAHRKEVMQHIETFERDQAAKYLFVFDGQTSLGNNFALYMGADGWPWGWEPVVYWPGEENEHLGRRLGADHLYEKLGEKVLGLFLDRLSINWPVQDE